MTVIDRLEILKLQYQTSKNFNFGELLDLCTISEKEVVDWLIIEVNESLHTDNLPKLEFLIGHVMRNFSFSNESSIIQCSDALCKIVNRVLDTISYDENTVANFKIYLVWDIADIFFTNPILHESNETNVALVLSKVCELDYRKDKWLIHDSDIDKFSQFYLAVYKSLMVLTCINNKIAREAIEKCKLHFDERIVEQANDYQ